MVRRPQYINEQITYTNISSGEVPGSTSATAFPTVTCRLVRVKAVLSNTGNVYVGGASVTTPNGSSDATTGLELAAGEDTGWIPLDNLNRLSYICDNAGDDTVYLALDY